MNWLHDVKIIDCGSGYNFARGKRWGYYEIRKGASKNTWILDYTDLPIVDTIWASSNDLLFGAFCKKGKFVGYFKMERIK